MSLALQKSASIQLRTSPSKLCYVLTSPNVQNQMYLIKVLIQRPGPGRKGRTWISIPGIWIRTWIRIPKLSARTILWLKGPIEPVSTAQTRTEKSIEVFVLLRRKDPGLAKATLLPPTPVIGLIGV